LVDIVHAGFDAGVRIASAIPPNMTIVPLNGGPRYRVVGSGDYFRTHPRPVHPNALHDHNCIRIRWPSGAPYPWEFEKDGETIQVDVPWSLSLDNHGLIARAAVAGVGLAYVAETEVADYIASGRLVPVLDDWIPPTPGFCLYYPERRPVVGFADALGKVIAAMGSRGD